MSAQTFPFEARTYDFAAYVDALNYIGGEWVPAQSGATIPVENPRHGKVMGSVAMSAMPDVEAAVAAAQAAQPAWAATPIKERAQVMFRLKQLMERDREELAWLVSHENGKDMAQAYGDVNKGIECVEFGCAVQNLAQGEHMDVSRGINCRVQYEPLGVVAGVTPFNFPCMVPLWMIPQAITAGNAFILKPSEQVPYSAIKLAVLLEEAGLPTGILSIINGGRDAVEALADHPGIHAFGFVGSTKVAKLTYARAAANAKRALCLGGAKNHLVVVPDADPELTAQTLVASAYGCAGQRCMAASVVIAVGDVQGILDRTVEIAKQMTLGQDMGSIINAKSVERITGYIDGAEKAGCTILLDGRGATVADAEGGYWVGPTIIDNVTAEMPAGCEEIFGPVLSIIRVDTLDQAIAIENANPYGNAAAIFTTNGGVARYATERFNAGMTGVNIGVPVPREPFSFGGWNDSKIGHGDMTGYDGYRFWTRARKVTMRWEASNDATWMS